MTLKIFLSYASEDQKFADAIAERITTAFKFGVNLKYMSQFPLGANFRSLIDEALDEADILLVLATGREKLSHSFTGYEVGFFRKSQQDRNYIVDKPDHKLQRMIIPIAIFVDLPDTMDDIEGLGITPADSFFFGVESLTTASEDRQSDKFGDLLIRIDEILEKLSPSNRTPAAQQTIFASYREEAKLFYQALSKLKALLPVRSELPKTRLTLRLPPNFGGNYIRIDDSLTLRCNGPTAGIFVSEQSEEFVPWTKFASRIGPEDVALNWGDAIISLIEFMLQGQFMDSDQLVFSYDKRRLFRLYVSEARTYIDRTRELEVYLIETLIKETGDPFTRFLAKTVAIAVDYRWLFLESGGPYGPSILLCEKEERKLAINRLLRDLRLLFTRSHEAGAFDRSNISKLYGPDAESLQKTLTEMQRFDDLRSTLYATAGRVYSEPDPTEDAWMPFINALDKFRDKTRTMNAVFLNKVLQQLERELTSSRRAVDK